MRPTRPATPAERLAGRIILEQARADGVRLDDTTALRLAQAVLAYQYEARTRGTRLNGVTLPARRLQILRLFPQGLTNEQIAARLLVSLETVKSHVKLLFQALGAKDRAQAVALGMVHGLILPEDVLPAGERAA